MDKFCDEWKLPRPEFKEQGGYFGIVFRNPQYYTKIPEIKVGLNKRQKKAINLIKNRGEITRKDYMSLNKVSNKTAYIELNMLVGENILKVVGKGRSTKYIFR